MKLDDTDFNVEYWATWSEEDFIKQCLADGVFKQYKESDRRALLKQAYQLILYDALGTGTKTGQV